MATNERTEQAVIGMLAEFDRYASDADRALLRMWLTGWQEVADEFDAAARELLALGEGEWPSRALVLRSQRAQNALKATAEAIEDLGKRAGTTVIGTLQTVIDSAEHWQQAIALSQLPEVQTGVTVTWSRVDKGALETIVKRTTKRIESANRALPADVTARMKALLIRGVAVGDNPNTVASQIVSRANTVFDGGLARARNIARTEMADAHRGGALASRKANADTLSGWRWHCSLSARTCPSCLAQHGSLHPVDEQGPEDHQQGRCTAVPVTKTWRDLGIDLDEPAETYPDAREWFGQQDQATKVQIMGAERLKRLEDGRLTWDQMSQRVETPGWRPSYRVRPLA